MTIDYHIPVLLDQSIDSLDVNHSGVYVDVTFGGGGHSGKILDRLGNNGSLLAFDQDEDALRNIPDDNRFFFANHNFRFIKNFLDYYGFSQVDGLLADLGVSSHHFDTEDRGFSFRFDSELDMRMNEKSDLKASDILNSYSFEKLAEMMRVFGGVTNAGKIAGSIIKYRGDKKIIKTSDLLDALSGIVPRKNESKFLAKIFQALRIVVNDEVQSLKELLESLPDIIKSGGKVVFISYHSVEDRMVKNFLRTGNIEGIIEKDFYGNVLSPFKPFGGVITPGEDEVSQNGRARSAKLRVGLKL